MKRDRVADLAREWEREWNFHAGCVDELRKRGGDADDEEMLAWQYRTLAQAARAELEWVNSFPNPFLARPETLADFFRGRDALESPGARFFLAALRVQKAGGREPVPGALKAILEALAVPGRVSTAGRRRGALKEKDLVRFFHGLIREANKRTRGLKTEAEICGELERLAPAFGHNATVARLLARRRGAPKGGRPAFRELAAAMLLGAKEREGDAERLIWRLKKATKRGDRKKKVSP